MRIGYPIWVSNGLNPWKKYYSDAFSPELVCNDIPSSTSDKPFYEPFFVTRALYNPAIININIFAQDFNYFPIY